MKFSGLYRSVFFFTVTVLSACGGGANFADLDDVMADAKARPKGNIDPIPTFSPYKAFTYSATALRGPFDKPVAVKEITRLAQSSNVKPDLNRAKEFLERFSLESLAMVGTLEQHGDLWMLIDDSVGGVHRVKVGNYLGKNHGRVIEASESLVSIIEIVPNGLNGWVERPRSLKLRDGQ